MANHLGQLFGNFRLLRVLGSGGSATVYLGEHIHLETLAAIKVLHINLLSDESDAFRSEARTIARLAHPHIVRVFDFGLKNQTPFLVMDHAPHGSLRQHHPDGIPLPLSTALGYVTQIASALHYAHQQQVIHRDIKPGNMLLGARNEVLLSDFGLALVASSSQQEKKSGMAGTIAYMAPEQIRGNPCLASDQYALGVVVYQWLTGILPFHGSSQEVLLQHLATNPPSLCAKVRDLPQAVEEVVFQALAKEPHHRFPSVEAFATALQQAAQGTHQKVSLRHEVRARFSQRFAPTPFGRTPRHALIGREHELTVLRQLLLETQRQADEPRDDQDASSSISRARPLNRPYVSLLGEAGIGKTRIAEEASLIAQQQGWTVLWGRAHFHEQHMAYRVWIDILRNALAHDYWPWQEISEHPERYQSLIALLPELAELFPSASSSLNDTGEQAQFRLWETVRALFAALSALSPLLIVLDDLQWADNSSCNLLSYLVRNLAHRRILLIGTSREQEISTTHPLRALFPLLQQQEMMTKIALPLLTESQIGQFVAHLAPSVAQAIQQQAAGNPFFAEELARFPHPTDISPEEKTSSRSPVQGGSLPPGIANVFEQHITQLSQASQKMLSYAAVLGNAFSFDLLQFMHSSGEKHLDEETLLNQLEEVLQAGLLTEDSSGAQILYHFWHPLLVEYLYHHLLAARRASLHRRAAQALQEMNKGQEAATAATIVYHLLNGKAEPSLLVRYAKLAGDHAYELSAYPEAEKHYRVAFQHTSPLPLNASLEKRPLLIYLLERLGECLKVQGHFDDALRYCTQALELYEQVSAPASHSDYKQFCEKQAFLQIEVGRTYHNAGKMTDAQFYCEQAEQLLQSAEITSHLVWARLRLEQGYIFWQNGNYTEALKSANEALQYFKNPSQQEQIADLPLSKDDLVNLGKVYILLALTVSESGQSSIALNYLKTALAIYERCESKRDRITSYGNLGDIYLRRAEFLQAKQYIQQSLALAEQIGDAPSVSVNMLNLGALAHRLGNLQGAEYYYKTALTMAEQINNPFYISALQSYLANVLQEQGNIREARVFLSKALKSSRKISNVPCMGLALVASGCFHILQAFSHKEGSSESQRLLRLARSSLRRSLTLATLDIEVRVDGEIALAEVLWLLNDLEAAQKQSTFALEEARKYELVWLDVRAQHLLGTILTLSGKQEDGNRHFRQAIEHLQNCGMRLEYARALRNYGSVLLQCSSPDEADYERGRSYLGQAWEVFLECNAKLDAEGVGHFLGKRDL